MGGTGRSHYIHLAAVLFLHSFLANLATAETNIITVQSGFVPLKVRITSDPYGVLINWTLSSSVCNWIGVTCGARHRRLVSTNVSNMDLTGSIPSELGNLSFLVSLDMTGNSGILPENLARMLRLSLKLTSLYAVLHKTGIRNWTPSKNGTVVTQSQARFLYCIGSGGAFVFRTILQFAESKMKATTLPFPYLVYGVQVAQGFIRDIGDDQFAALDALKIARNLLKGSRKIDLPWSLSDAPCATPEVGTDARNMSSVFPGTEFVKMTPAHLKTQIAFARDQISHAEASIAHYKNLIADYELLLDVGVFSGQKGGVGIGDEEDEDHEKMKYS